MESYFERLQQIGTAAVADLQKMDAQHAEMEKSYLEERRKDCLTEQGYRGLLLALENTRRKKVKKIEDQITALQDEYDADVEKRTALNSSAIDSADLELLKKFPITAADFDLLAEKHQGNHTMLRLLDAHRKEHHIKSNWRYQTPEQRKEIFNGACFSVGSIVRQMDKYNPDREGNITEVISHAYHKLQDSKSYKFPIPTAQSTPSAFERMSSSGVNFF